LQAFHQTCLAHPIRRCRDLLKILTGTAREFPQAVLDLLLDSLDLRDRHQQKLVSEHGLAVATGRLQARLERLLATPQWDAANQRLARHLQHEQPHLFTFLYCPGIPATNNFTVGQTKGERDRAHSSKFGIVTRSPAHNLRTRPIRRHRGRARLLAWTWCESRPYCCAPAFVYGFGPRTRMATIATGNRERRGAASTNFTAGQ
jgi:hypothetical protein